MFRLKLLNSSNYVQDMTFIDVYHVSNDLLHGRRFSGFHFMNAIYAADFVSLFELPSKFHVC